MQVCPLTSAPSTCNARGPARVDIIRAMKVLPWLLMFSIAPLVAAGQSPAKNEAPPLTPGQIISRAVQHADWLREQKLEQKFTFMELAIREELTKDGGIKTRDVRRSKMYPVEGVLHGRVIERNGQPLSAEEQEAEDRREQDLRRRIASGEIEEKKDQNRIEFDQELIGRYRVTLAEKKIIDGRSTHVITFEPKSGRLPIRKRIDYALNKSGGKIFIDAETFEVARVEFRLIEPVGLWWGLLGKLRRADGSIARKRLEDGYWAPTEFNMYLNMRILFSNKHYRRQSQWSDHRLWTEPPEKPPAGDSN